MPKKGGEDALPAMPSWEGASSKKVMEEDAVELEPLKKSPAPEPRSDPPLASVPGNASPVPSGQPSPYGPPQGGPMGGPGGYMPAPSSARDPYSPQDPFASRDPYAPQNQSFANVAPSHSDDGYGLDQPYDAAGGAVMAAAAVPNRNTPSRNQPGFGQPPANQGFTDMPELPSDRASPNGYGKPMNAAPQGPLPGPPQGYGMRRQGTGESQRGPDGYGMRRQGTGESRAGPDGYGMRRQGTGDRSAPDGYGMRRQGTGEGRPGPDGYGMRRQGTGDRIGGPGLYGMDPRARQSPGPRRTAGPPQDNLYTQSPRQSPAPQRSPGFGARPAYNQPQDSYAQSYQEPAPQELPALTQPPPPSSTQQPYGQSPPQSPIVNNAGFDFNSGFSRPTGETSPTADGYPGYKAYQPARQGWN